MSWRWAIVILVAALWTAGYLWVRRLQPALRTAEESPEAFRAQLARWASVLGTLCLISGTLGAGFGLLAASLHIFIIPGIAALCFGGCLVLIAKKVRERSRS